MRSLRIYNPEVYSCQKLGMLMNVNPDMAWKVITNKAWKLVAFPSYEDAQIIAMAYLYDL